MMKTEQTTVYDTVNAVAEAMIEGRLDVRGDVAMLSGQDAELVGLINRMLDTLILPIRLAAGALDEIAHGRIPPFVIDEQKGEYDQIKRSINTLLAVLYGMHSETMNLTDSVREGRLGTRGNDWDYEGIWKELISGMNKTLDAVVDPVHEASEVLGKLAAYDLKVRMHGKYRGDHAVIRDAMNATANTLQDAMSQVTATVELATAVGRRVMESSSTVAAGAREQGLRLEDATGNLDRLAENARSSSDNTNQAQVNAQRAADAVTTAKQAMERMLVAMSEISESAESTATIISEIDSIAKETGNVSNSASEKAARMRTSAGGFGVVAREIRQLSARCTTSAKSLKALEVKMAGMQRDPELDAALVGVRNLIEDMTGISIFSNLLGINASIEAAHVVGAGTDFRELTNEIRTLAIRSADAARRTEALIRNSVVQSRSGVTLTNEIDQHLAEAAAGADAISRLAFEISKATNEQAGSIGQINESVSEINKVTQNNATSAADSLGAASNLNGQMEQLSGMVKKFKV
jgi:methyl-accepting chemotaxis protein